MDPLTVGLIAVSAGSAIYNGINQQRANDQNSSLNRKQLALSREQFDYQKSLNERVMEREDTAYQRAVSDMQKAGLNPLTATGGASASSMFAGTPMSAGNNSIVAPYIDPSIVANLYTASLQNATNEKIAQMQQRGVDMANAYSYDVGMANAFANQLKAFTDYRRSGVYDPAVLKALKDQIIADAKNAENTARGSGTTADLLQQEYEGRSKSGNYRGMPEKIGSVREGEQYVKDKADKLTDIVTDLTDDKTGLGKVKSGENIFSKILSAMNSANRGARKQASRQLLRGIRRR